MLTITGGQLDIAPTFVSLPGENQVAMQSAPEDLGKAIDFARIFCLYWSP